MLNLIKTCQLGSKSQELDLETLDFDQFCVGTQIEMYIQIPSVRINNYKSKYQELDLIGSKFFKVYQNLVIMSHFSVLFT